MHSNETVFEQELFLYHQLTALKTDLTNIGQSKT